MSYKAEITYSSKELTKREAVKAKDLTDCIPLDKVLDEENPKAVINVDSFMFLHISNDLAKGNKEYDVCVVIDTEGNRYKTGSESFMRAIEEISTDLLEDDGTWGAEGLTIKAYKKDSKNFDGKFITCSLA